MDGVGRVARSLQPACDTIRLVLGLGEDQDSSDVLAVQQGDEEPELLLLGDHEEPLIDGIDGRRLGGGLDHHWFVHEVVGEGANGLRDGGGEEQRLPIPGNHLHDPANVRDETHVEHAVGFVEDKRLDARKVDVALVAEILQSSRGGDEHVDASLQRPHLVVLADASVDNGVSQLESATVRHEAFMDLGGEFTRRAQDQCSRGTTLGTTSIPSVMTAGCGGCRSLGLGEPVQDWKCECTGLPGAGLRGPKDIASFECGWNRTSLDLRW